jgi:hypothetical protein
LVGDIVNFIVCCSCAAGTIIKEGDIAMIGILLSGSEFNAIDAEEHLLSHEELYWCVPFNLKLDEYTLPITALLHVKSQGVRYKLKINKVLDFQPQHFENPKTKPLKWIEEYNEIKKKWCKTLVITEMQPFDYETTMIKKINGELTKNAPQKYTKIIIPKDK